jgi:peptidoglycan/LPS O-acetylase OafA/YrhL
LELFFYMKLSENNKNRISSLDGLRGIVILAVVIYHYFNNLISANSSTFNLIFKSLTKYFYTGVDMFFVLSGFLLGGILLKNKTSPHFFKTFYIRRICRIFPLYFLVIILVYLICSIGIGKGTTWWFSDKIPTWVYFTFLQNIFMGIKDLLGNSWLIPTWSLGVEEQFYLIISFLIYFSPKKTLVAILIIGIVLSPIFRYNATTEYGISSFLYCRLDSLFGGIVVAMLNQNEHFLIFFKKYLNYFYALTLILFGITILFSLGKWHMPLYIVNSWFSVIYMLLLLLVLNDNKNIFSKLTNFSFFVNLGIHSFSIYLLHQIILGLCFFGILNKLPQINSTQDFFSVLICAITTYFVAKFVYINFEKKFMDYGHRYKY